MSTANATLTDLILTAEKVAVQNYAAEKIIPLLDLTSLNDSDNKLVIEQLCSQAVTPLGNAAAVCIYPQFITTAKHILENTDIKICSVANFPDGNQPIKKVYTAIEDNVLLGADEIDVVIPYSKYLDNHAAEPIETFVRTCKHICGTKTLKVILETGAIKDLDLIYAVSCAAIQGGADFLKTSTGKIAANATLEAAVTMLTAIKKNNVEVGFKVSGGVRYHQQAAAYLFLADCIMGDEWISPQHFRIGASSLLGDLIKAH